MIYELDLSTSKQHEIIDITPKVKEVLKNSNIKEGICIVYSMHTTAGIIINENDDPKVCEDILNFFKKTIPKGVWQHDKSGKCDRLNADAHIKSSIIGSNQSIIVDKGDLALGTWQSIFLVEFDGPRQRKVLIKMIGD